MGVYCDVVQVWKQKGEEYRISGQGGWYWVSVSRPSRHVAASNLGLRLVAKKLEARKLKQQSATAIDPYDQKPSPTQTERDEKPSISDGDQKDAECKPELECQENEDIASSMAVKDDQQLEDAKEGIKREDEEMRTNEAERCKAEVKDEELIDVSGIAENSADVGDNFSVSEALISRTFYPRITKPYSKLDTFLDRRLLQFHAEQKQRLLCEQLIEQYRAQEADRKKLLPAPGKPDTSTEAESDVAKDVDTVANPDCTDSSTAVNSSHCYSALCNSTAQTPHNTSCYSPICRQHHFSAESPVEQLNSGRSTESAVEVLKEDAAKTSNADDLQVCAADTGSAAEDITGCKKETTLTKVETDPVSSVVNSLSADTVQNCMTSARRARSRVSRKKASAVITSRNKSFANSDKAAPSLSLQKYTQDGKIHLTADLVKELEEALAICGQTQQKVSLVRRAGPGRPPTKINSRLSGIQKKVGLPPVHRFMSGRSSRRSLFALEQNFLTTLARREGRWECPGFNYACKMTNVGWPYPCPRPFFRTAWRYRTQTLHSIASAAVQLRVLWACIRWDDIKAHVPPGGTNTVTTDLDITTTELLKKRDLPPYGLRSEYLVRKIVVPISVPTSQPRGELCNRIVYFCWAYNISLQLIYISDIVLCLC